QSLIDGVIPKSVIIDIIASTGGAKALTAAPLITSTQFTYSLTPPADETLEGDITWLAQVYGPGGVSDSGVTVQPDLNDSTKVTVTVDGDVMGDVVLYAFYISGSGKIVIAKPVLVTSRPAGNALTRIESIPSSLNLSVGDATGLKLWQHFDNDQSSRLYPSQTMPPHFTSSNEAAATVNAAGLVFALDQGTATIGCDYAGFHAETDVTVTDTGAPRTLHNLSTRLFVQTGGNVGIAGFIISGNAPKQVLIRAIGPELAQAPFNVPNTLQSPVLALYAGQTILVTNDGWQKAPNSGQIPATLKPGDPREPAILTTLQPGSYTAILSGRNGTTGNALVEVYDVDNSIAAQVANVSTRGVVQGGGNVMIAGFIAGDTGAKVLIRALGPTLGRSPYDVPNVLQDPSLTVFDANGTQLSSNDDWQQT